MSEKINFLIILTLLCCGYCKENSENECKNLNEKVQTLQEELRVINKALTDTSSENKALRNEFEALLTEFRVIKQITGSNHGDKRFVADGEMDVEAAVAKLAKDVKMLTDGIGSTYVRWGRTTCPGNTTVIYKGFMGGNVYTDNGGPANYLCLPDDPTWAKYQDGIQNEGNKIYGSEYEHHGTNINPFPQNMMDEDIPCAVCSTRRPLNIMVPARTSCYTGWHLEYTGYLMTIKSDKPAAGEYVCIDDHPEAIPHGTANTNGNVMYLVEAVCGTLPCLPYVNGRELACSVCSK
ncbi:short-chain collagen C4-like isoform X2 [Ruditapes philippinarum]|uniref:short-chain collagen C4-like isoform X2 n=1 Tax=Ruditapes philippinarum TaxID=129788 RepID=UPI00295B18F6|nr:short-chain collagen C4-like isoform X2 [Ruditapes philippinarum]